MGLLLSVLVACVGVLEVIACYTHFRLGIVYNQCKSDVTDVARNYAWELRRNHLHHLFPDGQPELEYAKTVRAYREKTQSIGGSVTVDSCNVITTPSSSSYLRVEREDENAPSYSNRKPSQDDTTYDQISEIDVDISEHIETYDRICHVENDSKTKNETNETTDNLEKAIEIKSEVNETIKPVQESDAVNNGVLNITDNAAVKISDNIEVYQVCTKQSTAANLFFDSQNETQLTNTLQQDVQLQTDECKEIKKDFPIKDTTLPETHQQKVDETPASLLKQESANDYVITQQIENSAPVSQNLPQELDASKDVKADSKPNTETNQVPHDTSKPEEIAEKADINEAKHVVELKEHKTSVSKEKVEQISEKTVVSEMQVSAKAEYKTDASVDDEKVEQISEKAETITEIKHEVISEAKESKTNESAIKQVEQVSEKAEVINRTTHEVLDESKEPKTKESAPAKQFEEVPEKAETITEITHEVVETEEPRTKESVVGSSEGTTHESEILKQSKTTEKLAEKVSEPTQISAQEKLAENKTTNSSEIIEETKVSEAEIIESKTVPGLLSTTKETPLNLQTLLEATGLKDVKESPELTVSTTEKSDNDTVILGTNDIIDTTLQTKVVPSLNSKPELIERITETGRLLSPLPENKISETTTPTVIPDSLKATPEALPPVPSPETGDSKKTEADLECEQFLSNTSLQPEDPLAVPRVPSPYPMSLFGITTDNGISDLMVNEDLLRSLDGIKRSDDRRRSFKKKRSSSSSSRASRDRSLDAEPKSDPESQPEKREKPTPLVSVEEKNTGEEDVNQEGATSETSQNVDSSSTQKRDSASEIRKSFQKAAVNSFEEATPSQNDEMNRREIKKTNDNEKQQGSFPQTDAFWLIFSAEYTNAMEKDWHGQHFSCWQCDESLTGQRYVLRDEHPYCVKCYEQQFANSCEKCNRTIGIDSKDLSYKEKHWHEVCFQCTTCGESLVDKQFGAKGEKIYCGNCYDKQFASRCDGCGNIFHAGTKKMEYKNRQWHEACFCCCKCKNPIGTKSFIPREKDIYCAQCYEEKFATRCIKCNKAIQSGGVTYKNEPWHRECFTCTHCDKNLAGQRFTSRDDQPCCAECFGRLFAKRCTACDEPITGIGGTRFISFEDRHWHNDCFKCASCSTSLVGRGFITDADKIICPECAKERFM